MCLAIPMKVVEIEGDVGQVELGGVRRPTDLRLLEEVEVGDYVIVHAGFAISRLDIEEAEESLRIFAEMGEMEARMKEPEAEGNGPRAGRDKEDKGPLEP
jgi:hydrogenase expression/formation protein HypC